MGAELKLTFNNASKISFFKNCREGGTLEMVLLMWILIAEVDYMAFISIEREEPCISPSPKNVKVLLDRLQVRFCFN
jgi:hypothetical protein